MAKITLEQAKAQSDKDLAAYNQAALSGDKEALERAKKSLPINAFTVAYLDANPEATLDEKLRPIINDYNIIWISHLISLAYFQ